MVKGDTRDEGPLVLVLVLLLVLEIAFHQIPLRPIRTGNQVDGGIAGRRFEYEYE